MHAEKARDSKRRVRRTSGVLGAALAATLAVVAYANTLHGELLYDDVADIVRNHLVRDFEVGRIFGEPSWATWIGIGYAGYRPLTTLTFALNHAAGGLRPVGYHLVNIGLHAAASALLVVVLARLGLRPLVAGLAGALFALHPVHTEAVASVVGRADVLSTLLALGCWWLLLGGDGRASPARAALAAVTLALAVLAKEPAVAIVGVIVVTDALLGRPRWATHALLAAVAGATLAWRSFVLAGSGGGITLLDNVLVREPWLGRVPTTLAMAARYAGKLVWPLHLSADYSFREVQVVGWSDPSCVAGLLLLVGLLVAALVLRRSHDVLVGLVLLAVPLALVVLVTFLALGPPLAERLLYLPSAGFCVLLALLLARVAERGGAGRLVGWATAGAVLVAYGALTVARNRVWHESEVFFRTMVADAPRSARSHRELGVWLGEKEKTDAAVAELEASMAILPHPATAYAMGIVLGRAGRREAAVAAYQNALSLKPDFVEAMVNLGTTYFQKEDDATALAWFARAMAINPNLPQLQMNSANSLQRIGRLPEAAERYARAVELDPKDPAIRFNYGICLERLNRPADAAQQYEAAAALRPDWPAPQQRLILALLNANRRDAAVAAYDRAARLFPDNESIKALRDSVNPPATP